MSRMLLRPPVNVFTVLIILTVTASKSKNFFVFYCINLSPHKVNEITAYMVSLSSVPFNNLELL